MHDLGTAYVYIYDDVYVTVNFFYTQIYDSKGPSVRGPSPADQTPRAAGTVSAGVRLLVGLLAAVLAGQAAWAATAEGRVEGEVDVLLRVDTHHERGHVDDLLADADVALADQNAGVVDRLGQTLLEDQGLQTALEEVLRGKEETEEEKTRSDRVVRVRYLPPSHVCISIEPHLDGQSQNVIELLLGLVEETVANHTAQEGVTLRTRGGSKINGRNTSGERSGPGSTLYIFC